MVQFLHEFSFMLAYTRSHICPSCHMEFISTLLTIFRTSCCPHVLIMSGKGDACADGQFKDSGKKEGEYPLREGGGERNPCR